jgi:hypothetical protein
MLEKVVYAIVLLILICDIFMQLIVFNVQLYQIFLVKYLLRNLSFVLRKLGTTMNCLRFPVQLRTGKKQFMNAERLKEREENETIVGRFLFFIINKKLKTKF